MKTRKSFATALCAVAIAAIPSAAGAVSASVGDPRYDQTTVAGHPDVQRKAQADITRFGYWTANGRVHFRVTLRDLSTGILLPTLSLSESRSSGLYYGIRYSPSTGWTTPALDRYEDNWPVTEVCHGKAGLKLDYSNNYVQMSFPKTCFATGHDLYRPRAGSRFVTRNGAVEIRDSTGGGPTIVPNP